MMYTYILIYCFFLQFKPIKSQYANLPRAWGTLLLAYEVAKGGDTFGCSAGALTTDASEYRKAMQGTNGAHVRTKRGKQWFNLIITNRWSNERHCLF